MSSITLHSKHGLNPAIVEDVCFLCNKVIDESIILPGARVKKFKEAGLAEDDGEMKSPIRFAAGPCKKCKRYMEEGVILISTKDGEEGKKDPYRTGGWAVVTDEAIKKIRMKPKELEERILKARFTFVPDSAWDMLGLPRGPVEGISSE